MLAVRRRSVWCCGEFVLGLVKPLVDIAFPRSADFCGSLCHQGSIRWPRLGLEMTTLLVMSARASAARISICNISESRHDIGRSILALVSWLSCGGRDRSGRSGRRRGLADSGVVVMVFMS